MIIGFNTDIKYRGKVYHAQTEDHGSSNPMVETLVYIRGNILDSHQTPYADLLKGEYDDKKVVQLMENQHRRVIQLIQAGHYLTDEERAQLDKEQEEKLKVIGAASHDEQSFDELVWGWMSNEMVEEEVELVMSTSGELVTGEEVELRIKASKNISRGVVAGAKLTIRFISTVAEPAVLFEGETDRMGECVARFRLPSHEKGNHAIIVRCESELGTTEHRQLVKRAA